MDYKITLIWAEAFNMIKGGPRVIGHMGSIPWNMPADMRHFKDETTGHPVIIGRKTFESFENKLPPNRYWIVISRSLSRKSNESFEIVPDKETALLSACEAADHFETKNIMIAGGAEIYNMFLSNATHLIRTIIHAQYPGDTHMPPIDFNKWVMHRSKYQEADDRNPHSMSIDYFMSRSEVSR